MVAQGLQLGNKASCWPEEARPYIWLRGHLACVPLVSRGNKQGPVITHFWYSCCMPKIFQSITSSESIPGWCSSWKKKDSLARCCYQSHFHPSPKSKAARAQPFSQSHRQPLQNESQRLPLACCSCADTQEVAASFQNAALQLTEPGGSQSLVFTWRVS